jgi:hypothetical protein
MKYKAYLRQGGEGCDYTIGCGQTVIDLEANSIPEAMVRLYEAVKETYHSDEYLLAKAEIFEVNRIENIDVKEIYRQIDEAKRLSQAKEKEEAERKEFERLNAKFGSK